MNGQCPLLCILSFQGCGHAHCINRYLYVTTILGQILVYGTFTHMYLPIQVRYLSLTESRFLVPRLTSSHAHLALVKTSNKEVSLVLSGASFASHAEGITISFIEETITFDHSVGMLPYPNCSKTKY